MNMADETVQKDPPSTATAQEQPEQPSGPVQHEPKLEADSVTEPPLASVSLDLQKYSADLGPAEEEHLKEAVTVVEKDTPLEAPPPEPPFATERVTVTAPSEKVSRSLYDALALSQEPEEAVKTPLSEKNASKKKAAESFASFQEESNKLSDLSPSELKALQGFRGLVREGLKNGVFGDTSEEEVSIWGIPMLKDDRTDVILLKFLRARDFKVDDSLAMLKNALKWRRDFNVNDELLKEDLGDDLEKIVFMHGHDKDGHPLCYNVYSEFQNKELYARAFSDEEKRMNFLRWRIQFLEKSIRKLDFSPGGINTVFQISDLKNSPGPGKKELRIATRLALRMLQDNYPEFVAKQVFINVPWWYLAFYTMMSPFLTQRTKSKFVFASPSRTAQTLFKYISPEQVPIQYGGLNVDRCECNPDFTVDDPATEITVKPATKQTVEIIVKEKCTLVWELRVVGWEVSYSSEYVPDTERQYTVIIQKTRKMVPSDEPVISSSFDVCELGKILLTIDNPTAKKKTLLYRFKVVPIKGLMCPDSSVRNKFAIAV